MADSDPLAKWRRSGAKSPSSAPETGDETKILQLADYRRALSETAPDGWLEIRPLKGPWALCSYAQLRKVLFNEPKPTRIDLIFSYERVTVKGRNLDALVPGLRAGTLARIEQFNPAGPEAPGPGPEGPVVESIECTDNGPR